MAGGIDQHRHVYRDILCKYHDFGLHKLVVLKNGSDYSEMESVQGGVPSLDVIQ